MFLVPALVSWVRAPAALGRMNVAATAAVASAAAVTIFQP
jgi:hypothetical protein